MLEKQWRTTRFCSLLTVACLFLSGCAQKTPSLTASEQKRAQKQDPAIEQALPLEHEAPPPAYGNKVVLAENHKKALLSY